MQDLATLKKCKYIKKDGNRCGRFARKGFSVCPKHGAGTKENPGGRPIKTGIYSRLLKTQLKDKIQQYRKDPKLLDLKTYIATKAALLDELLKAAIKKNKKNKRLNVATINNAVQILSAISQDVERLHKMEHGEKHIISISVLEQSITVIVGIIDKEISDEKTKARIFRRLGEFGLKANRADLREIETREVVQS
jgi:hypothetical protein